MKAHRQYINEQIKKDPKFAYRDETAADSRLERKAYFPSFSTLQKLLGVLGGKMELTADACHLTPVQGKVASARR